ncbi:arsenate reductase/protein-tyrosine-phosphatase family protein [Mycolicibacterium poriferae]|nr:low molecular weight phosphatase family protein [Mycolicibacterium poriferae]
MLFVCTGNICRSPTAERLALAYAAQRDISGVRASSAGTRALVGQPIHHEAALVLEELGGDASGFAARRLGTRTLAGADLVLGMTKAHRDAILELAPQKLHRVFTLAEASRLASDGKAKAVADLGELRPQLSGDDIPDIADPIGQNADVFAMVGFQIARLLPPILELCRDSGDSDVGR